MSQKNLNINGKYSRFCYNNITYSIDVNDINDEYLLLYNLKWYKKIWMLEGVDFYEY